GKRRGDGLFERCLLLPAQARAARPVPGAAHGTGKAPADAARTLRRGAAPDDQHSSKSSTSQGGGQTNTANWGSCLPCGPCDPLANVRVVFQVLSRLGARSRRRRRDACKLLAGRDPLFSTRREPRRRFWLQASCKHDPTLLETSAVTP